MFGFPSGCLFEGTAQDRCNAGRVFEYLSYIVALTLYSLLLCETESIAVPLKEGHSGEYLCDAKGRKYEVFALE